MNKRELESAISDEVAEWPGVSVEFVNPTGKGHPKAKFRFGELVMTRPYPSTPSDGFFGLHRCLADMRRVMKQMGAERPKPEPSEADTEKRYSKPNEGRARREMPLIGGSSTPDAPIADKLVEAGAATAEQRAAVQAEKAPATYRKAAAISSLFAPRDDEDEDEAGEDDREQRLAELQARIDAIVDGVYFDLPEEVHHGVRALGSSALADLDIGAATFWRGSWLDPDRPELDEESTKAQIVGKAYHAAILEPDRFDRLFVREISKADFPAKGFLSSDEKVRATLKALGQTQKIGDETAAERAERLLDFGYEGTIFPLEKARWQATVAGRQPISGPTFDEIMRDAERIAGSPEVAQNFRDGFAEVSVFWTDEHGLRCKARFDYLKPDRWADLKSFANPRRKHIDQVIADAFRYERYYLQATHYRDAAEAIRTGGLQVQGEATDDQRKMIAQIQIAKVELECHYVFQEKGGVPNLFDRQFKFRAISTVREHEIKALMETATPAERAMAQDALSQKTEIFKKGTHDILRAKSLFAEYSQIYEPGQPWAPIEPMGLIDDNCFHPKWLEERADIT